MPGPDLADRKSIGHLASWKAGWLMAGWACVTYQTGMVGWFMWLVRLDGLCGISGLDSSTNLRIFETIFAPV